MTVAKKTLTITAFLFGLVMFFCFIGFKLGYSGFFLIGEITLPFFIVDLIAILCFSIQTFIIYSFILDEYDVKKAFIIFALYIPVIIGQTCLSIYAMEMMKKVYLLFTALFPNVYILGWALCRKRFKKSLIRALIINGAIILYQGFAMLLKMGYLRLSNLDTSLYETYIMNIDIIIFMMLIYAIGGVKNVQRRTDQRMHRVDGQDAGTRQYVVSPQAVEDSKFDQPQDEEDKIALAEFKSLVGFEKARAILILLGFQVFQWSLILLVCYMGQVFLEGLVITLSFMAHGMVIKRKWHSPSLIVCTLVSVAMFYLSARISISFQYSQFFPILIGLSLIYCLYRVAILVDRKHELELKEKLAQLDSVEEKAHEVDILLEEVSELV